MPVRENLIRVWETAPAYYEPVCGQDLNVERLRQIRAQASRDRDEILCLQKQMRDPAVAKILKEEARAQLRRFRAADLWFKWTCGEPDTDPPIKWPIELANDLDHIYGLASL